MHLLYYLDIDYNGYTVRYRARYLGSYKIRLYYRNTLSGWQEAKCPTLGSARRNCDGSVPYAKRETTPKARLEPKKFKRQLPYCLPISIYRGRHNKSK